MKALIGLTRFRPRLRPVLAALYWIGIGISILVLALLLVLFSPLAAWDWFARQCCQAATT